MIPAYDSVIQAASGLMSLTGTAESGPLKTGAPILDYASGLTAAFGIVSAILARVTSKQGGMVEVAMLEVAFALMQSTVSGVLNGAESLEPRGNHASSGSFFSRTYVCATGALAVAVNEPHQTETLLTWAQIGADLAAAQALAGLSDKFSRMEADLASQQLNRLGVPCAVVQRLDAALAAADLPGRGMQASRAGRRRHAVAQAALRSGRLAR